MSKLGGGIVKKIIFKSFSFDCAHSLPNYKGKCHDLHGHSFKLLVGISGDVDEESGMILDFSILKRIVNDIIVEKLDHKYLNDIIENPTAENIIDWVYERLFSQFIGFGCEPVFLRLYETEDNYVEWRKE